MVAKLGSGGRFKSGVNKIMKKEGYSKDRASAIMASAGRKKYGATKFNSLSKGSIMNKFKAS